MRFLLVGASDLPHERACTHWTGLKIALQRMESPTFTSKFVSCRGDDGYAKKIIAWKPDVVVYNLLDMAKNHEDRERIRTALPDATICFWYADLRNEKTGQVEVDLSKTVDKMFITNDGQQEFVKKHFNMATVDFLPQAVEPTDTPQFSRKAERDFLFIGCKSNNPGFNERKEIIETLEKEDGLFVLNGNTPDERASVYLAMPKLYSSAYFSLDISHFWDIEKYTSNRYWVIPGFWGFALTKRFPGHEDLYPESVRVYWDTLDELRDKMKFYKKNPKEREQMILKGWEHTKNNHTYTHRLQSLLSML
jgi:hypothetical protein